MDVLPDPVLAPDPKVVVHNLPWGKVMRQQTPRTPTPHDIEDRIENFALGVLLGAPSALGLGHIGLKQRPFLVAQVSRVRFSGFHTSSLTHHVHQLEIF